MKIFISILAVGFMVLFMTSCGKFPKVSYYKIKVGPDKFATIKEVVISEEPISRSDDVIVNGEILIKYNGIIFPPFKIRDSFAGVGTCIPVTVMEYENYLYVAIMTIENYPNTFYELYRQNGKELEKIKWSEFPKNIALKNFFKPGRGQLVDKRTGHKGTHFLNWENRWLNEPKEFDRNNIENFSGSGTGDLWYYLENGKNYTTTKPTIEQIPIKFFKFYIEKYKPLRMKIEEMKEITAKEAGFSKIK